MDNSVATYQDFQDEWDGPRRRGRNCNQCGEHYEPEYGWGRRNTVPHCC
jgi:hypothetical protein